MQEDTDRVRYIKDGDLEVPAEEIAARMITIKLSVNVNSKSTHPDVVIIPGYEQNFSALESSQIAPAADILHSLADAIEDRKVYGWLAEQYLRVAIHGGLVRPKTFDETIAEAEAEQRADDAETLRDLADELSKPAKTETD